MSDEKIHDRYVAANLDSEKVAEIQMIEERFAKELGKNVRLVAYEESQHNPT
ncbi:hypothetical protein [Bacillus sp. JCM 19034]|uniref:hypothetical protein n=1 Tax=Bacillus sp. JCM 19034 TaxID=1481928 RepID=UPI000B262212|nr:hypothetical protein [Bacillus sp. JCM 19034]